MTRLHAAQPDCSTAMEKQHKQVTEHYTRCARLQHTQLLLHMLCKEAVARAARLWSALKSAKHSCMLVKFTRGAFCIAEASAEVRGGAQQGSVGSAAFPRFPFLQLASCQLD